MIPKIGAKHGRLTVAGYRTITKRALFVICECGRTKTILVENLARTHSCGCLNRDVAQARETTHGMTGSRTYRIWSAMIRRCYSEKATNYANYGGRGIAVCDSWRRFEGFFADMGEAPARLSLERTDNDGNYEPGNCCWATSREQASNRRNTILVNFRDQQVTLEEAGRKLSMTSQTFYGRMRRKSETAQQVVDHFSKRWLGSQPGGAA